MSTSASPPAPGPSPGPSPGSGLGLSAPADDRVTSTALAFVAGFVDAAGFVALFGLFTSHVTGNFVLIGAELVARSDGVLAKLLALPAFVAAVAAARLIALGIESRGRSPLKPLLALQALLLAAFAAGGLAAAPIGAPDGLGAIGVGLLGVAAMGVQNALGRLALGHLASTTVMTVNVTQAVIDAVDVARLPAGSTEAARRRLGRMLPAVAAFAFGAVAGAFGITALSFACLAAPIAVLAALVVAGRTGG